VAVLGGNLVLKQEQVVLVVQAVPALEEQL
jgi:hypothetical protein